MFDAIHKRQDYNMFESTHKKLDYNLFESRHESCLWPCARNLLKNVDIGEPWYVPMIAKTDTISSEKNVQQSPKDKID